MSNNQISGSVIGTETGKQAGKNRLFPVFLKIEELNVLLVGGGNVGLEKLNAILQNAPAASIWVVATEISAGIKQLAANYPHVVLEERPFQEPDLNDKDVVIVAVNDKMVSNYVRVLAKEKKLLVNVADTPEQCDFYLGSIVQKGDLKIAISTNGKSPTIAKRMREQLNELIPDEIEGVLNNMHTIRQELKGDFTDKVKQLDDLTKVLAAKQITLEEVNQPEAKKWPAIVKWCLLAFLFMLLGHAVLSFVPFHKILSSIEDIPQYIDVRLFGMMVLTGFLAQMVDGSMGMGYGTISTVFLLATGVPPAIVSSRVHSARVFSSGASGYTHHRFGNINKKLFRALVIPGVIGAILGATLAYFGQEYAQWVRIPLSFYTIYLGYYIIKKAFKKKNPENKVKGAGWLASVGGFTDAFAGGGWGALVTGTLLSKRKNPRYVIGSVCLAEFFVVLASSVTFFIFLKHIPILDVAGLIIGGLIAAPIAARLVGVLPMKTMFLSVGTFVILASTFTLWKAYIKVLPEIHQFFHF
ncbi:MAG TPA: TSUP family transporter [Chitinophagaceae bacterium]|nr:TSUP family transporter [Chitinophagaceae bacterium]